MSCSYLFILKSVLLLDYFQASNHLSTLFATQAFLVLPNTPFKIIQYFQTKIRVRHLRLFSGHQVCFDHCSQKQADYDYSHSQLQ
jgi:hypothetical protein